MKPKILLVEDDVALRATLKEYLIVEYDIITARTARQALTEINGIAFGAAIVDLGLPDSSGIEIIKALRKKSSKTTILVSTGDQSSDSVHKAIAAGANDYLIKPIIKAKLLDRLQKAMLRAIIKD